MSTPSLLSTNYRANYGCLAFAGVVFTALFLNDARKAYKAITQTRGCRNNNPDHQAQTIVKVAGDLLQIIGALSAAVLCIPVTFWVGKMAIEGLYYKEVDHLIGWIGSPLMTAAVAIHLIGLRLSSAATKNNRGNQ